jgi:hypothetical protein
MFASPKIRHVLQNFYLIIATKERAMRRLLSLGLIIGVFLSLFAAAAGKAQAAGLITYRGGLYVWGKGIVFVFDASGYRNKDVKDANIFVGSNFHHLGCTVNQEEDKIVCVLRGGLTQYAGETGVIYLGGQVFYVIIPDRTIPEEIAAEETLVCSETESMGAWVTFTFDFFGQFEFSFEEFVEGASAEEVESTAAQMLEDDPFLIKYEVGEFGCFEVREEGEGNEEIPA